MFEYFYHEILRRTVIGFGTLFNNIIIKQRNSSNQIVSQIKVPLAYGPTQKFLARLNQSPDDLNNPVQITLPRMSFEFTGLTYDSSRNHFHWLGSPVLAWISRMLYQKVSSGMLAFQIRKYWEKVT